MGDKVDSLECFRLPCTSRRCFDFRLKVSIRFIKSSISAGLELLQHYVQRSWGAKRISENAASSKAAITEIAKRREPAKETLDLYSPMP